METKNDFGKYQMRNVSFSRMTIARYGIDSIVIYQHHLDIYRFDKEGIMPDQFPFCVQSVEPAKGDPLYDLLHNCTADEIILDYLYDQEIIPFGGGELL